MSRLVDIPLDHGYRIEGIIGDTFCLTKRVPRKLFGRTLWMGTKPLAFSKNPHILYELYEMESGIRPPVEKIYVYGYVANQILQ